MSSEEKKAQSNDKSSKEIEKEKENEDPGFVQFKEETFRRYLMYKTLELPWLIVALIQKVILLKNVFYV